MPKRRKKRSIGEPGGNGELALEAHHLRPALDLDADRDDGGFHLLDDVGKADRPLRGSGHSAIRFCAAPDRRVFGAARRRREGRWRRDRRAPASSDKTARGKSARLGSGIDAHRTSSILSIFLDGWCRQAPLLDQQMGSGCLTAALAARLKFGKVGELEVNVKRNQGIKWPRLRARYGVEDHCSRRFFGRA